MVYIAHQEEERDEEKNTEIQCFDSTKLMDLLQIASMRLTQN
jgi:hypothetical protein